MLITFSKMAWDAICKETIIMSLYKMCPIIIYMIFIL